MGERETTPYIRLYTILLARYEHPPHSGSRHILYVSIWDVYNSWRPTLYTYKK